MATTIVPRRTPSPRVRIRSQSFDSPSSGTAVTPIEESPYSKSTGAVATKAVLRHDVLEAAEQEEFQQANVLLRLHTKMSDESIMSNTSSASSSDEGSATNSNEEMDTSPALPPPKPRQRQRPHPLTFCQSITDIHTSMEPQPSSPFLYQDTAFPMYSPWLVRVVLDLYDLRGLDWMSIAEPVESIWGVQTNSAEVLSILSDNGRVLNRRWWD